MQSGFHIEVPPRTELHRLEIELRLKQMRDYIGQYERWFETKKEVADYLNDIGVRHKQGRVIRPRTITAWHKKYGFPWAGVLKGVNCSNLMIAAWLWSMRVYRATRV
jgi:hypothetical protein